MRDYTNIPEESLFYHKIVIKALLYNGIGKFLRTKNVPLDEYKSNAKQMIAQNLYDSNISVSIAINFLHPNHPWNNEFQDGSNNNKEDASKNII